MKLLLSLLLATTTATASQERVELSEKNCVNLRDQITFESVTPVQLKLAELVKARGSQTYPIYLVLDSPGGSVEAGESFIEFATKFNNVQTLSIYAASMASAIVQAMPGRRLITPSGIQMFHRASGRFQGQFEVGEVETQLELWKTIVRGMENRNAQRLGISLESYKAKIQNEYWLHGQKNIDDKAADAIAQVSCTQNLIDEREVTVVEGFFGSSKIVFSACPLIRGPIRQEVKEE